MLFVSHRPAILQWVDKVMVMEGGHLIAMDSHENLIATNSIYRSLFNLVVEEEAAGETVEEIAEEIDSARG